MLKSRKNEFYISSSNLKFWISISSSQEKKKCRTSIRFLKKLKTYIIFFEESGLPQSYFCNWNNAMHQIRVTRVFHIGIEKAKDVIAHRIWYIDRVVIIILVVFGWGTTRIVPFGWRTKYFFDWTLRMMWGLVRFKVPQLFCDRCVCCEV